MVAKFRARHPQAKGLALRNPNQRSALPATLRRARATEIRLAAELDRTCYHTHQRWQQPHSCLGK